MRHPRRIKCRTCVQNIPNLIGQKRASQSNSALDINGYPAQIRLPDAPELGFQTFSERDHDRLSERIGDILSDQSIADPCPDGV